jgi:germination protein M
MKYRSTIRLLAAAGALALFASGCSLKSAQDKAPIDPPPDGVEATMNQTTDLPSAGDGKTAGGTEVTLYYKDNAGFVVPVSLSLPETKGAEKTALEYLVADGPVQKLLPQGFTALLPKGTVIRDVSIGEDKVATVDFSAAFTEYNPADERKILEAVTWTLTGFPKVQKVKLRVEGQDLHEMVQDATPLDEPLSRSMGINLELGKGVGVGRSTPVTLYFRSQTDNHFTYFVPVTRLVERTADAAKATVNELVKGPNDGTGLLTAVSSDTQVLSVKQTGDESLVNVDFGSKFLDAEQKASPEAVEAVILSLADSTGIGNVRISVNGDTHLALAGGKNNMTPVSLPVHVNPYKS